MQDYQKLYAYHEKRDGQYELKSYWTSSQTVEFDDGDTLEEYKTALSSDIDSKGDEIDYSLDDGEIYLYSNGRKIATEEMSIRVAPNIQLDDISNLSIRLYQGNVRFTWTDPSDVIFSELPLVEWDGTKVVRKVGSAPNSVNDGTLVLDSKVRDAYSSTPYYDNNLTSGNYYYYRFFPYDKEGNYYGRTCGEVYKPIVLIPIGIPYLTETYTYTGSNITPNFVNYDTNTMTRSGTVYAKNAGTYTTTFTLKEGYKWSDDTTQPKEVTWSIGKAEGFISLSKTQVEVDDADNVVDISVRESSGAITVTSGNSSIVTASYSNDIISLTYVSNGTTTVQVNVAGSNNYESASTSISVLCTNIPIYGIKIGRYISGTSHSLGASYSERLDSASEAIARAESLSNTGYSSFDAFYPWSDIEIIQDPLVGEVVKIPKYYYRCYDDENNGLYIKISRKRHSGYQVSPGHADRGDGKGERDYIYVGRYLSNSSNDYKSVPNTSLNGNSETISSFRTNIHNLREDVWLMDNATWWTYLLLYLVEYGIWNYTEGQPTIFSSYLGFRGHMSSNIPCSVSNATNNGATDNMMFHTGCLNGRVYKRSQKLEDYGYSSDGCQYRYIESFGSTPCFIDGVYNIIDENSNMNIYNVINPLDSINGSNGVCVASEIPQVGESVVDYTVSNDGYSLYPTAGTYISISQRYGTFSAGPCDQFSVQNSTGKKILVNRANYWELNGTSRAFVSDSTTCTASRLMILP